MQFSLQGSQAFSGIRSTAGVKEAAAAAHASLALEHGKAAGEVSLSRLTLVGSAHCPQRTNS